MNMGSTNLKIDAEPGDRKERRRRETRQRLLEAALRVIGRKGIEATTIADITEEADVGLGTFYHHFESKEVLLGPVFALIAEKLGAAIDAATENMADPAQVIATAVRFMVGRADHDAAVGRFVVRTMSLREVPDAFLRRNMRDLQRGIESGRFKVEDPGTAQALICGGVTWVMQARLLGKAAPNAGELLAQHLLLALGVPAAEAAEIARRPLPAIEVAEKR